MTTQPEALRLADRLDLWGDQGDLLEAAAELRRLHEAHDWQYRMAGERLRRVEKLETQRKPLSEEEIDRIRADCVLTPHEYRDRAYAWALHFARAVERAHGIPMPEAPTCPDCHGIGYDASGQTCACQENPSF